MDETTDIIEQIKFHIANDSIMDHKYFVKIEEFGMTDRSWSELQNIEFPVTITYPKISPSWLCQNKLHDLTSSKLYYTLLRGCTNEIDNVDEIPDDFIDHFYYIDDNQILEDLLSNGLAYCYSEGEKFLKLFLRLNKIKPLEFEKQECENGFSWYKKDDYNSFIESLRLKDGETFDEWFSQMCDKFDNDVVNLKEISKYDIEKYVVNFEYFTMEQQILLINGIKRWCLEKTIFQLLNANDCQEFVDYIWDDLPIIDLVKKYFYTINFSDYFCEKIIAIDNTMKDYLILSYYLYGIEHVTSVFPHINNTDVTRIVSDILYTNKYNAMKND